MRRGWIAWLLLQAAGMIIATLIGVLLPLVFTRRYALMKAILQLGVLPAVSALSAYFPCFRGLSHYLGWIIPPVAAACVPWAAVGYPLSPGIVFLCALLAMVGASAGAVKRRREQKLYGKKD